MNNFLRNNKIRFMLSATAALIVSLILNFYIAKTEFLLIPVITLYTMQTAIGNTLYQGMQKLFVVFVIITAAALAVYSMHFFYDMMHDALIGGCVGMVANLMFLPRKPDTEFREKILPVIKIFNEYFSMIIDRLLQQDTKLSSNAQLENALLQLPDWVYAQGFDSRLQTGYRFFLVKIEQISDVLMSMHHLARYHYDKELIAKIRPTLLQVVENMNQFFSAVGTVFELKTLTYAPSDLENEMNELQKQFYTVVPFSLELLDMRRDYVYLAAFIYDLKDLRKLLLKLGEAIR